MPEGTPLPRPFDPLRPLPFVFRPAVFRVPIRTFAKITRRQISSSQTPSSTQPTGNYGLLNDRWDRAKGSISSAFFVLLCLLLPAIFAQTRKTKDLNDEPFLPIHPVYPYSPKLIKRGTETESTSQLTSELYAPKIDAKDSYSSNYNNNHHKDSYYPNYDLYSKNNSPSSVHPSYNSDAYPYANLPYVVYNPYSTQYPVNPALYPSPSYPNYYYQPPYYYPHYFNHASLSPLPTPSSGIDYQETLQDSTETSENDKLNKDKQSTQPKENETNQDASTSQFVDGGNYISGNLKDLDGQSSTYKIASLYNQLDVQAKGLPIFLPKTTYRVISVAGQPVGPDYPLPASYVKVQQMEQLMSQTLDNLLPQKQTGQSYENDKDVLSSVNDESYANQNAYTPNTPSYVTLSGAKTKTGVTYVINVDGTAKVNGERTNLREAPSQKTSNKNTRYLSVHYVQKPVSQMTYASSDNRIKHRDRVIHRRPTNQRDDYNYGGVYDQSNKQEQNNGSYQNQSGSYQNKDFTVASQTPRSYSYKYSAYELDQAQQQDKINLDDGNFGNKQYNKG
ncbi:myb-like protein AA [Formica exsecta]|uniref:myb-like protein AA n=1 Tax=Formica exsecta TaxID=72781 RepID=UPI001141F21C|nr:myb-like protein AA [Formica exsecta]